MNLAPIALFVYNRYNHTQKTIEALQKNFLADSSELFIYSDFAKNEYAKDGVEKVRDYIKTIQGFKSITIVQRSKNWGLANSIIDGVSSVINKYGKIIVLEDDLVTSKYFLKFMNEALDFYKNQQDILSITGYNFPKNSMQFPDNFEEDIYRHIRPMSWSWATWIDRWSKVEWSMKDFNNFISCSRDIKIFNQGGKDLTLMLLNQYAGRIDSWYIRWAYHAFRFQKYTIYPKSSFVQNLGFDNSGVHGKFSNHNRFYHKTLEDISSWQLREDLELNSVLVNKFNRNFLPKLKTRISLKLRLLTKLDSRLKSKKDIKF